MTIFITLLLVVQIAAAVAMIGLILVQHGKGADAGAAFGGGAGSATLFGASGGANFLSRTTAVLATVFLICTLLLASLGGQRPATSGGSVLDGAAASVPVPAQTAPESTPAGAASQIPGK